MSIFEQEWNSWNPEKMLQNLQKMQQLAGVVSGATESVEEVTQESLAKERRRLRLKAAGTLEPRASTAALASVGRCPRVEGNAASERIAVEVERFVRSKTLQTLVLIAAPGRGKSFAAAWAIAESVVASMWLPADNCRVGSAWDATREKAMKVPLLVIDDLGEEAGSDWGIREMAVLLQNRHNAGLRTIVTTNFIEPELDMRYGERLMSRWFEDGVSRIVAVDGVDLRRVGK